VANLTSSIKTFDINVHDSVQTDLAVTTANKFIAFTNGSSTISESTDGITWAQSTVPYSQYYSYSIYDQNKFVVYAYPNVILSSTDGSTWTRSLLPESLSWSAPTFGNNTFVMSAGDSMTTSAASSTNGITWTTRTLPAGGQNYVYFVNNIFLNIGAGDYNSDRTAAATSTDGITWTTRTMPASKRWRAAAYGNSVYVATTNYSTSAATSTDGITWTLRTVPAFPGSATPSYNALAFGNSVFVALPFGSTAAITSTDGITWTQRTLPYSGYWSSGSLKFMNGNFVAVSGTTAAIFSTNGITWTTRTLPAGGDTIDFGSTSSYGRSASVQNLYKDATLGGSSSVILEPGIVLGPQNSITVRGLSSEAFSVYGTELS
jgi:hypothetical protein